jgi:4-amino-4-deoxy-L-arabinose transferase-like glycosyltransferase
MSSTGDGQVRDRPKPRDAWVLGGAALLLHLAVAGRYDFFRDELYFIVCGRHPAFGYVDQPPLVPLLSAASQAFGEHLVLLRAIPAVAAGGTVVATCALARLIGCNRFGILLAGIAAGLSPMYLGIMTTLNTSSFEPLLWTALTWLVARAVILDQGSMWIWAGAVTGLDLEIKYELPLYLVPLIAAVVLCGHRQALWKREAAIGIAVAAAIAAPSALWQLRHDLPFLEMVRAQAGGKNTALSPLGFVLNQVLVMNPLLAPLWIAGAVAPFIGARLFQWRFISVAFGLTFGLMLVLHAKDYYLAPAYGPVFAVGAGGLESVIRSGRLRAGYVTLVLLISAVAAPMAMPILDPPVLAGYIRTLHLTPNPQERLRQGTLPQTFADMLGWRSYVRSVALVYDALPRADRARAAIFTGNYGEAAALDFYGAAAGLPPALSAHNQYFLWGPRGFDGSVLIRVNEEPEKLARRCHSVALGGRFGAPYVMPYEDNAPISVCWGLEPPLSVLWPALKFFY